MTSVVTHIQIDHVVILIIIEYFLFLVTVSGNKTIKGYLVLALPAEDSKRKPIGNFEIIKNAQNESISQDKCVGVSKITNNTSKYVVLLVCPRKPQLVNQIEKNLWFRYLKQNTRHKCL